MPELLQLLTTSYNPPWHPRSHPQAESVYLPGNDAPMRFCQQCGKFEPVSAFDGAKRWALSLS